MYRNSSPPGPRDQIGPNPESLRPQGQGEWGSESARTWNPLEPVSDRTRAMTLAARAESLFVEYLEKGGHEDFLCA